jgi:predicted AAA+ superfamily ATPase
MQTIPQEEVATALKFENPWWNENNASPAAWKMRSRPYLDLLYPLVAESSVRRAVILLGPRRVGKTVLIEQAISRLIKNGIPATKICYASVDRPIYSGMGLEDILNRFQEITGTDFRKERCFIFFDEIQYLRDWERHLKAIVDLYPNIRCTASGSAAAALRLKSRESGAGRFTDFMLPPLTFSEYLLLCGKDKLIRSIRDTDRPKFIVAEGNGYDLMELNQNFLDYLNFGGYPEVALSPEIQQDPARFIKEDVIDKVLLRDLPSLYGIQDIQELNRLFTVLAYNSAQEVSLEELSKNSGVAKNTIKRYIEYLEAAFLIRVVNRVDENAKRFKRATSFKVYLVNPSMRTALFSPMKKDDPAMGSMVETALFAQWFHMRNDLYYARWRGGEIDIVNFTPDLRVAGLMEVKWSDRYADRPEELKALLKFSKAQKIKTAWVTTKNISTIKQMENTTLIFEPAALCCFDIGDTQLKSRLSTFNDGLEAAS